MNNSPADNGTEDKSRQFRRIKSYVLRGGRLTAGQKRALEDLWPVYGIEASDEMLDFDGVFGNTNPVIIDIGFGDGESTWRMARHDAGENFLGIEVHPPGVGHLLIKLEENHIDNVRIACADAVEVIERCVPDASLQGARLFFPDPWPKKRHHKRRIVQTGFVELLARKFSAGACLHMATDWAPYAEHMLGVLHACDEFVNTSPSGDYCQRPLWRAVTKYEARGQRLGHRVYDLIFRRKN